MGDSAVKMVFQSRFIICPCLFCYFVILKLVLCPLLDLKGEMLHFVEPVTNFEVNRFRTR